VGGTQKHVSFNHQGNIPSYTSLIEDCNWVRAGMVATSVSGDSTLAIQQRVEDAGFSSIVVTPMGSDCVFLDYTCNDDIWQVFNSAIDFFSMLFANVHKWTSKDDCYERGAWIRVYGTSAHAWNEAFFKIGVSGCGRFLRADVCTVDKARLDYASVLVLTPCLEVVNMCPDIYIDGSKYSLRLVEEWGCNLGADSFLTEEDTEPTSKTLFKNNVPVFDEVHDEVEALVNDLNDIWSPNDAHYKTEDCHAGLVNDEMNISSPVVCV